MPTIATKSKIIAKIVREQSREIYAGEWRDAHSSRIALLYALPVTETWRVALMKHRGARYRMNDYKTTIMHCSTVDEAIKTINEFLA